MDAKEKAKELYERFNKCNEAVGSFITTFQVKQCALIAVNEILNIQVVKNGYWQQVREEIEKL